MFIKVEELISAIEESTVDVTVILYGESQSVEVVRADRLIEQLEQLQKFGGIHE